MTTGLQAAVEIGRNPGDLCALWRYLHDPGDCGSDQRFREKGAGAYRFDRRTQYERNFRGVYQTADKSRRDHHNQTGVGAAGKRAGAFYRTALFVIDSLALKNIENLESQRGMSRPDFIEGASGSDAESTSKNCEGKPDPHHSQRTGDRPGRCDPGAVSRSGRGFDNQPGGLDIITGGTKEWRNM